MPFLLALLLLPGLAGGEPVPRAADPGDPDTLKAEENQAPPDSGDYVLSTRYTYEHVSGISAWHNRELSLEMPLPIGTVVGNIVQKRRFGRNEISGGAHYWADLWGDSYGHVHVSAAPNALIVPRFRIGGDLYAVFGSWEVTGKYEWRRYAGTRIHMTGPQIGWYLGNWYLRLGTSVLKQGGQWFATQRAGARYYLGSPDSYVDGQVGYGRTVEFVEASSNDPLRVAHSYFGSVRLHHFFTSHVGASVAATYSEKTRRRLGASLGLVARW